MTLSREELDWDKAGTVRFCCKDCENLYCEAITCAICGHKRRYPTARQIAEHYQAEAQRLAAVVETQQALLARIVKHIAPEPQGRASGLSDQSKRLAWLEGLRELRLVIEAALCGMEAKPTE